MRVSKSELEAFDKTVIALGYGSRTEMIVSSVLKLGRENGIVPVRCDE
ncbi:MAG: hypothetical protein ACRC8Q_10850 [Aeromonas sp.]